MNYKEEIIKIVNSMDKEETLRLIYAMLKVISSDPEDHEASYKILADSFALFP